MPYQPFGVNDDCPLCHKKCVDMAKEHDGRLLQFSEIFIVCIRCGNPFVPHSRIKYIFEAATAETKKSEQVNQDEKDKTELQPL